MRMKDSVLFLFFRFFKIKIVGDARVTCWWIVTPSSSLRTENDRTKVSFLCLGPYVHAASLFFFSVAKATRIIGNCLPDAERYATNLQSLELAILPHWVWQVRLVLGWLESFQGVSFDCTHLPCKCTTYCFAKANKISSIKTSNCAESCRKWKMQQNAHVVRKYDPYKTCRESVSCYTKLFLHPLNVDWKTAFLKFCLHAHPSLEEESNRSQN